MKKNILQLLVWILIISLAVVFEPPKLAQSAEQSSVKKIEVKPFLDIDVAKTQVMIEKGESEYLKKEREKREALKSKSKPIIAETAPARIFSLDELKSIYSEVSSATGTPANLIEAVHQVESGKSSTCKASYAGAIGPFQFLRSTFAHYGQGGNICDVKDSALAAGKLLAANGAASGDIDNALFNYNHSWSYVAKVKSVMDSI